MVRSGRGPGPQNQRVPRRRTSPVDTDPRAVARAVGLRYVNDGGPGIRREPRPGGGFRYIGIDGKVIRRAEDIQRIAHLAVPPAWTDVWICPTANGHIQATGRDARRRKQYRYHARWREARDATKYERTIAFGMALPRIRDQVSRDLRRSTLCRERVLATIVRLLDTTYIRVGNEEYARENRSYGLTTMLGRHVDVDGADPELPLPRQERQAPRCLCHRSPHRPRGETVPGTAGTEVVPVGRR